MCVPHDYFLVVSLLSDTEVNKETDFSILTLRQSLVIVVVQVTALNACKYPNIDPGWNFAQDPPHSAAGWCSGVQSGVLGVTLSL